VLYYIIEGHIYAVDVFGKKWKVDVLEDGHVAQVMENKTPMLLEHDFTDSMMKTPDFTKSWDWIYPLLVDSQIIGVLKMENLFAGMEGWETQMPIFFNYVALVLRNSIYNFNKLEKSYKKLEKNNKALEKENKVRKQVEKNLFQLNDKQEKQLTSIKNLNEELESFTNSVSHDLRAPLRPMIGFSQIMMRDYHEQMDKRGCYFLERINTNALRMSQLLDDLLHLSRLIKDDMNLTRVDLSHLARVYLAELQQSDHERKVKVHVDEDMLIIGDLHLLLSLVENLIGNAWKYTSNTEFAWIRFTMEQEVGEQVFSIKDNGAGFDMSKADKLFAPFQRMHSDDEFQGTGIGLATVKRIVQRHGGHIWADATPNQGATFHFTLGHNRLPNGAEE